MPIGSQGPGRAREKQDRGERQQQRQAVDLMLLYLLFLLFCFCLGQNVHTPEHRRQTDEQSHVRDVVDQRVGQHLGAGTAFGSQHKSEDQVPDPRTIGHHQRAVHVVAKAENSNRE